MNDEKIICQPRRELLKMKCPVSRRAFLSSERFQQRVKAEAELRQKTGTIPA
jgi:hypothetical protein